MRINGAPASRRHKKTFLIVSTLAALLLFPACERTNDKNEGRFLVGSVIKTTVWRGDAELLDHGAIANTRLSMVFRTETEGTITLDATYRFLEDKGDRTLDYLFDYTFDGARGTFTLHDDRPEGLLFPATAGSFELNAERTAFHFDNLEAPSLDPADPDRDLADHNLQALAATILTLQ